MYVPSPDKTKARCCPDYLNLSGTHAQNPLVVASPVYCHPTFDLTSNQCTRGGDRWAVEEADADLSAANANGCTVAHWASSGGDEAVCRCVC